MAPSKPLQNANTTSLANLTNASKHEYGLSKQHQQQQQQYNPITPSPLNPTSNSSRATRPTTLPRRHTVSGAAPTSSADQPIPKEKGTSNPVVPRPVRHTRRHSGSSSSVSPTERLMRYKGALAWRSATLRRHNTMEGSYNADVNEKESGKGEDTTTTSSTSTTQKGPSPGDANTTNEKEKEKAGGFHVVFLDHPSARERERGKDRPRSPLSYHPVGEYGYYRPYCTEYTTTPRSVFRRPRPRETAAQGMCYDTGSTTTTTTLQRASFAAVALLFGMYMILHAFFSDIGRGTGNGNGNSNGFLGTQVPTEGNASASWDMSQGYYR
ncbi:hypothetical protein V8F20_008530 [Naviculisporaceae sp. PSN 640]